MVAPPSTSSALDRLISWCSISGACSIFFFQALDYILHHVHCDPSLLVLRCVHLTDAEAAEEGALWVGILCCAVLQVAAAALAWWLLPSRRRRLRQAMEFLALAAAIVGHCMYAAVVRLVLTADPGYLFYRITHSVIIACLAVNDILSSIALILSMIWRCSVDEQSN